MKVKDLIAQLATYEGDTDLVVAYWDKETVENYASGWGENDRVILTDDQWSDVVSNYDDGEWHFQSSAADTLADLAREVIGE